MKSDHLLTLLLAIILTHHPSLAEHQHPKPELRCIIINDGYCTAHEKADLCSINNAITRRPHDDHQLVRIETVIKSTGPRPDQTGNVTVNFVCKIRDGAKCFPHVRTNSSIPSAEEFHRLTEARLAQLDPEFGKYQSEYLKLKKQALDKDLRVWFFKNHYAEVYQRVNVSKEHEKFDPTQTFYVYLYPEWRPIIENYNIQKIKNEVTRSLEMGIPQFDIDWTVRFNKGDHPLAHNFSRLLNASREKTAERLRNQMCNSGVCNKATQECAPMVCGRNMVCEEEPLDTEYMLTVQEMYKKIRKSGVGRMSVSMSVLTAISLPMLQWTQHAGY